MTKTKFGVAVLAVIVGFAGMTPAIASDGRPDREAVTIPGKVGAFPAPAANATLAVPLG